MSTAVAPAPTKRKLRVADRCDACPAQARLEATSPTTSLTLLFCFHHANKFEAKLTSDGFFLHDERDALFDKTPAR